jgi:hypothetical protein
MKISGRKDGFKSGGLKSLAAAEKARHRARVELDRAAIRRVGQGAASAKAEENYRRAFAAWVRTGQLIAALYRDRASITVTASTATS